MMTLEMGAPITFATQRQATVALFHFEEAARVLANYKFEERMGNGIVRREPIGVCGLITPWNWPLNQVASKVAPALATGCTVVLKPSEIAPLSAMLFAEIVDDAGLPAGVFNLVNGDGPTVGEAIAAHPEIDMVSFTGSTSGRRQGGQACGGYGQARRAGTGRQIRQHHPCRCRFESRRDRRAFTPATPTAAKTASLPRAC